MLKNILLSGYCILLFISCTFTLSAQTIENSINLYGTSFPREKIHIHFDKESYMPGETIWFKAYLFEENLPSERSTNFYAAIYDDSGKIIKQQLSPVFMGSAEGHFDIPDSIKAAQLICRAYTSWMLNFDTSMLFAQAIKLVNPIDKAVVGSTPAKTTNLNFFAEGGDVIEGIVNTIAFKANYNDGLPFLFTGIIKNHQTGEILLPLVTQHDGMGKFDIDIRPGEKYYAEWVDNNEVKRQTWLPEAKHAGVSLKLAMQKDKLYFNLSNKTGNDSLHVLMYMYQKIFYKANFKIAANEPFTGMLPIDKLPTGVMQITVFDANWQPVAERVAFINNNNFSIAVSVISKELSISKRGKNMLEITVADTIPANMSLSISDADMNDQVSQNTILSNILLKGDIKGYIHNPAFYFTNSDNAALKNKLDLVMLTHGWRRYNWADMMLQKMPAIKYPADEYLGVYGQIGKDVMTSIEKEETVNLIVKTADSTVNYYSVKPDKSGLLRQTGLFFYDSAKVYFSFNKNKLNNGQIAFSKYNFTYPSLYNTINNYKNFLLPDTVGVDMNTNTALFQYYIASNRIKKFNTEKTLKGVTVKTGGRRKWQNDPLLKMDEKYATGMFAGGVTGYNVDVLHDERSWTKLDIYNYLRSAIPSLQIGNYNLLNGRSLSYINKPVLIYIDEHEMTTSELETLSLSQVAYIKLIPYFVGSGATADGGGFQPALSVYTIKGEDRFNRRLSEKDLGLVKVAGYSPIKEFYSPDYAETNASSGTDARTTLLWMPYLLTDKATNKIPVIFYNNDFTKKMRIVLEGVNDDGKMIRIEKIIE